ncbi:MAG: VOC family protein [Betaproteobacteria bacterium]|jgi:Glyoxalase-like domain
MAGITRRDANILIGLGLAGLATGVFAQGAPKGRGKPVLDHIVWVVPELEEGRRIFEGLTGVASVSGGRSPGKDVSHNALANLGGGAYFEIFSPSVVMTRGRWLDLSRDGTGPKIASFCMRIEDEFKALQEALPAAGLKGTPPRAMGRVRTDGHEIKWKLLNVSGSKADDSLPFFIDWLGSRPHPAEDSPTGVLLKRFEVVHPEPGEVRRIFDALGIDIPVTGGDRPSFAATLDTPKGSVVLRG